MDRLRKRCGTLAALAVLAVGLVASGGCVSLLTTAMYLIKGTDVPPEYSLKGKKVCVVCRTVGNLQYQNASAARDLARQMNILLVEHIGKVEMTDQRKVEAWMDENLWDDFQEVGKAMKVEEVVAVELEHFSIQEGQTLYQGKANATLKVVDVATGDAVFEKTLNQIVYPPNAVMTTSEIEEGQFRRRFMGILADHIARHFYAHDPRADYALDATIDD